MKLKVLKLGTVCTDIATGLTGTLTHWWFDMGKRLDYLFQPRGLNEKGQPLGKRFVCLERLQGIKEEDFEEVEIPFEILGTMVEDKASGFSGTATQFLRHINGCFHVEIQPAGMVKDEPIKSHDFDLRGCTGEKIIELSAREKRESEERNPSPSGGCTLAKNCDFSESALPRR